MVHAWYMYGTCMVHDCIDRDAAAAGQPPGQSSHPAARGPGASSCLWDPGGASVHFAFRRGVTPPMDMCVGPRMN